MTPRQNPANRPDRHSSVRPCSLGGTLLALIMALSLTGCAEQSMSDLEAYVKQIMARPGKDPEQLPEIAPYVIYAYSSSEGVDPFQPFFVAPPEPPEKQPNASDGGIQPDSNRNVEELEAHPLDALRMMGTLESDGVIWAIVRAPDSVIHRVKIGNFIGKNHGKIVEISEEVVALNEIIPDGQGGWVEREASLALFQ